MRAATVFLALFALSGPCLAAEPAASAVEAGLSWRLAFGGRALEAGYGLSLGYRNTSEHFSPLSRLVEFRTDRRFAAATVAGLPLFTRSFQANQSEADAAYDTGVIAKPWYTRSWFLWTAGGIAASAALATAGSSGDEKTCAPGGTCNQTCAGNTLSTCNGSFCVQGDENCVPTNPAVGYADRRASFGELRERIDAALDEGTGGMGDLY
jgi:hypothetical protein